MILGIFIASIVLALIAHEGGHALAAKSLHLPWRLVWTKHGPGVQYGDDDMRLTRWQVRIVAASGPLANIALAALAYPLGVGILVLTSLEIAFFNLILPNSDGARVLRPGRWIKLALAKQSDHFSSEPSDIFDDVRKAQKALSDG